MSDREVSRHGREPDRGDRIVADVELMLRRIDGISAELMNNAAFVQLQSNFSERLFDTISFRYDSYDRFGGMRDYYALSDRPR